MTDAEFERLAEQAEPAAADLARHARALHDVVRAVVESGCWCPPCVQGRELIAAEGR